MRYSVIIPSKTISNLVPCVTAVLRKEPKLDPADIVVVDDGLEWTEEAMEATEGVTVIPGVRPFIFARNVNAGIRATFPKIDVTCAEDTEKKFIDGPPERGVVLLNDDALLETRGGFSLMAKAAEENQELGIIGATCNNVGNPNQHQKELGLRTEERMVCFVCVLIPPRTLSAVGLLDEQFVNYGMDDDDYCLRVRKAGLKIGIHDGCYVDHGRLKSSYRDDPQNGGDFRPNLEIFKQKWGMDNWGRPA